MPKIKEILTSYLKDIEISTHLNSYEAMATGAAFNGANFSSLFRARPILLSDGLNFPVNLVIRSLNEAEKSYYKSLTLFSHKAKFEAKRSLTFS